MRVFRTKEFDMCFKRPRLKNEQLIDVVKDINKGLIDVNLGTYIYKQRVAIGNKGKSRVCVFY